MMHLAQDAGEPRCHGYKLCHGYQLSRSKNSYFSYSRLRDRKQRTFFVSSRKKKKKGTNNMSDNIENM